jgi:hypothetical protein
VFFHSTPQPALVPCLQGWLCALSRYNQPFQHYSFIQQEHYNKLFPAGLSITALFSKTITMSISSRTLSEQLYSARVLQQTFPVGIFDYSFILSKTVTTKISSGTHPFKLYSVRPLHEHFQQDSSITALCARLIQ